VLDDGGSLTAGDIRDKGGRLIRRKVQGRFQNLGYDGRNRLIRWDWDGSAGTSCTYDYDHAGRRILTRETVGGATKVTRYVYDGADVCAEYEDSDNDGDVDRTRVYWLLPGMDRRIGFAENVNGTNTFYYYLTDQVGTVLQIVKEDGTVVNQYDYDAFGRVRQASPNTYENGVENRYLFQGREWDKNGGFYYFRNRIYLPERGEFATPDMNLGRGILGELDGMATLTFCGGDPVNCMDPTGLMPDNDFSFDMKIAIVTAKDRGMTISEAIDQQQKLQTSIANKSIPVFVGLGAACFGGAAVLPYVSEGALGYFTAGAFSAGVGDAASQVTEKALGTTKSYSLEQTMWMANLGGVLSIGVYGGQQLFKVIKAARNSATEVGPTIQNANAIQRQLVRSNPLTKYRPPARPPEKYEDILISSKEGLQTTTSGQFQNVTRGTHGDPRTTYLWTVDQRGLNLALERTPFSTPRGYIVHSNLSKEASIGGEAWFVGENEVVINAGSGRFGAGQGGATLEQWKAAIEFWERLGYKVRAITFGNR
jgi:RHS repeat-associated protein